MRELLLLDFNGTKYGVWKDDVASVKEVQNIHRLPFNPAYFAGVSVLDDNTLTLFDLGVCTGFPPVSGKRQMRLLLIAEKNKSAGFVVEGEIEHISVPSNAVFPMPDCLKTQAIETCVVHNGRPVPVINISFVYAKRREGEWEPVSEFLVSGTAQSKDPASIKDVRIFRTSGESFAVSASYIEEVSVMPVISRLGFTPPYVEGIVFHKGIAMPVIDLSRRLKLSPGNVSEIMLVAHLDDAKFGFRVDSDEETLSGEDFTIRPLPPLVRSGWMRSALLRNGEIIPLIHLPALMSKHQDEKPLHERYKPRSRFPGLFGTSPVEVREFLLFGMRYCLPDSQVESVIDLLPYRQVLNVQHIVAGVAEHDGELLPVIDLAPWFGRASKVTPEWKMMLVKNGDFRALLLTEAVFKERVLPTEIHRTLPITLLHKYVYGCYPDDVEMRVILDLEAMTVHFDSSAVKNFIGIISREGAEVAEDVGETPESETESIAEEQTSDLSECDVSDIEPEETSDEPLMEETPVNAEVEEETDAVTEGEPDTDTVTPDTDTVTPDTDTVTPDSEISPADETMSEEAPDEAVSEEIPVDAAEEPEAAEDVEPAPEEPEEFSELQEQEEQVQENIVEEQTAEIAECDVSDIEPEETSDEPLTEETPVNAEVEEEADAVTEGEPDTDTVTPDTDTVTPDSEISPIDETMSEEAPDEAVSEEIPVDAAEEPEAAEDVEPAPEEPEEFSESQAQEEQVQEIIAEEQTSDLSECDVSDIEPEETSDEPLMEETPVDAEVEEETDAVTEGEPDTDTVIPDSEISPADETMSEEAPDEAVSEEIPVDAAEEPEAAEDVEPAPEEPEEFSESQAQEEQVQENIVEEQIAEIAECDVSDIEPGATSDEPLTEETPLDAEVEEETDATVVTKPKRPQTVMRTIILEDLDKDSQADVRPFDKYPDVKPPRRRRRGPVYAVVAAILIIVALYLSGVFVSKEPGPHIDTAAKRRPSEIAVKDEITSQAMPPIRTQHIEPEKPQEVPDEAASEEISINAGEKPAEPVIPWEPASAVSEMYKVKNGDTLWSISESHTGDPSNYYIIVTDNEIQNPDFILPDQVIVLNPTGKTKDKKR